MRSQKLQKQRWRNLKVGNSHLWLSTTLLEALVCLLVKWLLWLSVMFVEYFSMHLIEMISSLPMLRLKCTVMWQLCERRFVNCRYNHNNQSRNDLSMKQPRPQATPDYSILWEWPGDKTKHEMYYKDYGNDHSNNILSPFLSLQ